jgi:hypothetical protein
MRLFLWVFPVCVACVFLLLFCMNLCICRMYLSILSYIYKVPQEFLVCICFNFVYSSKILCGIAQLDVGDATFFPSFIISTLVLAPPRVTTTILGPSFHLSNDIFYTFGLGF